VSRIADTFARLRQRNQPGLVTYTTAGDPDLTRTAEILRALDRAGADILEVGVPFSDPLADGPVIQRATERALAAGGNLRETLRVVAAVRGDVAAPIVIFSYANPIVRMGVEAFAAAAAAAGVDGVLVLDLPVEEAGGFRRVMGAAGTRSSSSVPRRRTSGSRRRPSSDRGFSTVFRASASPARERPCPPTRTT
jgi:tryptophan synthase alpha chain